MEIKTIKIKNFKSIGDAGYKACVNNCNLKDDKCIEPKENCIIEDWGLFYLSETGVILSFYIKFTTFFALSFTFLYKSKIFFI